MKEKIITIVIILLIGPLFALYFYLKPNPTTQNPGETTDKNECAKLAKEAKNSLGAWETKAICFTKNDTCVVAYKITSETLKTFEIVNLKNKALMKRVGNSLIQKSPPISDADFNSQIDSSLQELGCVQNY